MIGVPMMPPAFDKPQLVILRSRVTHMAVPHGSPSTMFAASKQACNAATTMWNAGSQSERADLAHLLCCFAGCRRCSAVAFGACKVIFSCCFLSKERTNRYLDALAGHHDLMTAHFLLNFGPA